MDEYADFEIVIQEGVESSGYAAKAYPVSAFYPGQPRASSWLTLDPVAPPWPDWQARLAKVLDEPGAPFLHQVGWALYQALFRDEVGRLWTIAQANLDAGRVPGVRVRLSIDPPTIAALPWELLYDEGRDCSIACRGQHPLVRVVGRIGQVPPQRAIALSLPLRVLFIAPEGTGLNWPRELEIVQDALARLESRAELRPLTGCVTLTDLSDLLGDWQPHVLHFVTHGDFDGTYGWLMFNSPAGGEYGARSDQLRTLLGARGESVRLVMLGACYGAQTSPREVLAGLGPALIQAGVPAVIGMQYEILDEAAIMFTRALYRSLLEPRWPGQIDAAVAEARAELETQWPDQQAYATPVLFLNAEHGRLFSLAPTEARVPVPSPEFPRLAPKAGTKAPPSPPVFEEIRTRFGHRTLRDLRAEMQALAERVEMRRRNLDVLRGQVEAYSPAERPLHLQNQVSALEKELAEDAPELEALQQAVSALEKVGVPEELTAAEFEKGIFTDEILEVALAEQPYEQLFTAADVARWFQATYLAYWANVVQRFGGQPAAEQALHRRLMAITQSRPTPRRRWFLIRSGDRFKRSRY